MKPRNATTGFIDALKATTHLPWRVERNQSVAQLALQMLAGGCILCASVFALLLLAWWDLAFDIQFLEDRPGEGSRTVFLGFIVLHLLILALMLQVIGSVTMSAIALLIRAIRRHLA